MQRGTLTLKATFLVLILVLGIGSAWSQTVQVSAGATSGTAGGSAVDVPVQITDVTNLQASHIEVTFNNTLVQFNNITRGDVMNGANDQFLSAPAPGASVSKVTVDQAVMGTTPWSGDGTLFTLSFLPLKGGNATITLNVTLRDANNIDISRLVTNGSVNVTNPAPTLASISPTSKLAGSAQFDLTLTGTNFVKNVSKVYLDGNERTTIWVSSTELTATIPASDLVTAGPRSISVENPAPGGGTTTARILTVTAGTPAHLLLTSGDPQSATISNPLANDFVVTVTDANDNAVEGVSVTFAIATTPEGAIGMSLSNAQPVSSDAGGQARTKLTLGTKTGLYTVTATAGALGPVTFHGTATPGPAMKLSFSVQPGNTVAGATLAAVKVQIQDAVGNLVTSETDNVTLAFGTNPSGGTLSGTKTVAAVGGEATFSTLSIDKAGTGYKLAASASGLTGATSTAFNITAGPLDHFVFATIGSKTSGTPFDIAVTAVDLNDNQVTTYAGGVTLTVSTGSIDPPSGTFSGGALNMSVTVTGSGSCTITANDGSGHVGTSNAFTLAAPPAVYLKSGALVASSNTLFPNTNWNNLGATEPNDWSFTAAPQMTFYIVPEAGMVLASCDVTVSWDGGEVSYVSAGTGSAAGLSFSAPVPGANQVSFHCAATGADVTIASGDYLGTVTLTILKPGHAVVQISNAVFSRTGIGAFAVSPQNGHIKAFLGDVANGPGSAGAASGDGLLNIEDLNTWSGAYWSGVPGFSSDLYKVKFDVGPTMSGYVWSMPAHDVSGTLTPGPDGQISFEDLVIFSISYGLSQSGSLPKVMAPPEEPLQVSLGQPVVIGHETRIGVMLGGMVSDVRAMSLQVKGQFGRFLGAESGSLLQGYRTPVAVMSRSDEKQVYVDLAVMGLEAPGLSQSGEVVVLRFEGTPKVQLIGHAARNSANAPLPVEKVRGAGEAVPTAFALLQNYPNPFNPSTVIEYELPSQAMTRIEIYNMLGERVSTLVNESQPAGYYTVRWNGVDNGGVKVPSGVYLCSMRSGSFTAVKKMLLVK